MWRCCGNKVRGEGNVWGAGGGVEEETTTLSFCSVFKSEYLRAKVVMGNNPIQKRGTIFFKSRPLFTQALIRDNREGSVRRCANWLLAGIHVCLVDSECSFF